MKVYQPKIEVRLVKVVRRSEIAEGVPVVTQRHADVSGINLTDFLGDTGSIRIAKGIREPAGSFSITFADAPHSKFAKQGEKQLFESLHALIEPMDMLEFRFAHDPHEYAKPSEGYKPPVVMRGLVSTVSRSETMSGGRPVRTVTVSGQDFGKILLIYQFIFHNGSILNRFDLSQLTFFNAYTMREAAKIKTANAFVQELHDQIISPYLSLMLASAHGEQVGAKVIKTWTVKSSIPGIISPFSFQALGDITLYALMSRLLDVGPFNELFVEDEPDAIALVVRPAPLRTAAGGWIQGSAEFIDIPSKDVVSLQSSRSDAGVANYFWVTSTRWNMYQNEKMKVLAATGPEKNYIKFDYINSKMEFYGIRKMEVESVVYPPGYLSNENQSKEVMPAQTDVFGKWLAERRRILAESNKDNVVFESGTMRVRGNEKIKPGRYYRLTRGVGGVVSEGYITRVEHEFQPMQGVFTTIHFERGTSFIERSKKEPAVYLPEIDPKGAT